MTRAFVYNPLRDMIFMFSGREYLFPKGMTSITDQTFSAPDEYRRNLANGSDEDKQAMHEMTLPAVKFAEGLLRRHHVNFFDAGFIVSDKEPSPQDRQKADAIAKNYKMQMIDEQIQERRERQAGGMGRLKLDTEIIEWMIELGIEDSFYNPKPTQTMDPTEIATAVALGVSQALNARQPEPVRK